MKKALLFIVLVALILPTITAIDISVEYKESFPVIVDGLSNPVIFNLEITNNKETDEFSFFNLIGMEMEPKGRIKIAKGETKEITIKIYPRQLDVRGNYGLQYFIQAHSSLETKEERLVVKIIDLENAFVIGTEKIDPESNSLSVFIRNKERYQFEDLNVKFSSRFFELERKFSLSSYEKKEFTIEIDKEDFKTLIAGFYNLKAEIKIDGLESTVEGVVEFAEKEILEEKTKEKGGIISVILIEKTNLGNTVKSEQIKLEKNIISRLFTSFSPEPDTSERKGGTIYYTWEKNIKPGETMQIRVTTNWLYPFILIILIVSLVVFIKKITYNDVLIRKKVSYVRAKGGEFALKINLFIESKAYVERVNIIDRLPPLMKVYERFGGEKPSRINEGARVIEWDFEKLEQGEVRSLSYIIYSKKIGVMGKFALPRATIVYQKQDKIKEYSSNRAFFVTEQRKSSRED